LYEAGKSEMTPQMHLTDEDELSVNAIHRKWAYFTKFAWTTSDVAGTQLPGAGALTLAMSPSTFVTNGVTYEGVTGCSIPTPLYWISRFAKYWRGGLEVRLQFGATKFHSGRMEVVYVPYMAELTAPTYANMEYTNRIVCDIRDGQTCEFKVPFTSQSNMVKFLSNIGNMTFWCLQPLVGTAQVTTSIDVAVYVRGGEDFELSCPSENSKYHKRMILFKKSDSSTLPVVGQGPGFGEPMSIPVEPAARSVSDRLVSLRQLIKMHSPFMGGGLLLTCWDDSADPPTNATYYLNPSQFVISQSLAGALRVEANRFKDHLMRVGSAFAYWKGGIRVALNGCTSSDALMVSYPQIVEDGNTSAGATTVKPFALMSQPASNTTATREHYDSMFMYAPYVDGGIEVNCPYYAESPASFIVPTPGVGVAYTPLAAINSNGSYIAACPNKVNSNMLSFSLANSQSLSFTRAAADDFDMGCWIGAPPFVTDSEGIYDGPYYNYYG